MLRKHYSRIRGVVKCNVIKCWTQTKLIFTADIGNDSYAAAQDTLLKILVVVMMMMMMMMCMGEYRPRLVYYLRTFCLHRVEQSRRRVVEKPRTRFLTFVLSAIR